MFSAMLTITGTVPRLFILELIIFVRLHVITILPKLLINSGKYIIFFLINKIQMYYR